MSLMSLASRYQQEQEIEKYTKICKAVLSKRGIEFNSLENDFRNGVNLLHFLEIVKNAPIEKPRWHKAPKFKQHQIENISIAIDFLRNNKLNPVGIDPYQIHNGEIKATINFIHECIRGFNINISEYENKSDSLLSWCKKNGIQQGVSITDLDKSWESGLYFCLLIYNYYPDQIDYKSLNEQSVDRNWNEFFAACQKLGIPLLFNTRNSILQSPVLIEKQINEMYYFLNYNSKLNEADKSVGILKDLSQFPLNNSLSPKFENAYQSNNREIQALRQQYNNKEPNLKSKIENYQAKINNEIKGEVQQLNTYVNDYINTFDESSGNDQQKYKSLVENFQDFKRKHKWYLEKNLNDLITSISDQFNKKSNLIWEAKEEERKREEKLNDYKSLFNQISQDFYKLQTRLDNLCSNRSSDFYSLLNDAESRVNLINSKHDELKIYKCEVTEFQYKPLAIQIKYDPLIQKIKEALNRALRKEEQVSQYETFCNSKLNDLNELRDEFNRNKYSNSILKSINNKISDKLSKLVCLYEHYNSLGSEKAMVNSQYLPESIINQYSQLSDEIQECIASLERQKVSIPIKDYQINQLIQFNQALNNNNEVHKMAEHVYNLPPLTYNNYPNEMTAVQPRYWETPAKYDSPIYSDLHEPIACKDDGEMRSLLHNMYTNSVPPSVRDKLGGERVIEVYSKLISLGLNESSFLIRCPHDLGFQRNQNPNSLFIHVKTQNIKILQMQYIYTTNPTTFFFHISIQNITNKQLYFVLERGTVIDLPLNQQPVYIAETWCGYINSYEILNKKLNWYCMKEGAGPPFGDAKLTPFIIAAPDRYFCPTPPNPDCRAFWNKVQPFNPSPNSDRRLNISNSNYLWRRQQEAPINEITYEKKYSGNDPQWEYLPAEIGGCVDDDLFNMLNQRRNCLVSAIEGVVRRASMTKPEDANNAMIINNQMGVVITILSSNEHILIEKTESGRWEGGRCTYNNVDENYTYKGFTYYKDFSSISKNNFYVGRIINGMRSDPKYFNSVSYNSQNSRRYLLGTLGINVPIIHGAQILIPSLHKLVEYI
ncbi:hypothetical protein M9Y10_010585 [Tritrichomonas musculus]|uniref:Calponin-homology (CH) domain-containing protein n=1 Tax=Tritrichomonas musculus TaxID=1915356 RepID=A0ABR2IMF9_9EUKA